MSIEQEERPPRTWMTGEEYGRARRQLIAAGLPADAPEFQQLRRQVAERDDYLFEQYGRPYLETHPGQWIAISLDGQVLIRRSLADAAWDGEAAFGRGNFAARKLADFTGLQMGL
jgi:hypothetical protein